MKVLTIENIRLNQKFEDKVSAIKSAGQVLVDRGYAEKEYINDMLEREKEVTTYIGNNVAIPHGLTNSTERIINSGISVLQVPQGVKFGDEIAYIVIGIAGKNNEHLEILGALATILSDMTNVEKIKEAKSKEEIIELLREAGGDI